MATAAEATTTDSLYGGAVSLRQPAQGYRVNVDALLLAAFAAQGRHADFAVDLGAGVGSVALGLHHLAAATRFALVERDATLLELARENANHASMSAHFWCSDVRLGVPTELRQAADLVVSNPPFFDPANTRPSREPAKSNARFGDIEPFLRAAAAAVRGPRARVVFIYPARELGRFLNSAEGARLFPKRMRLVHADYASPARVALVELRRAKPGGLEVQPPWFEWSAQGLRSPELERILLGERLNVESTKDDRI